MMTIDLSVVTFDNGLFQTDLPNGDVLYLYALDESLGTESADVVINEIIIELLSGDTITNLSSIVGLTQNRISLLSKYTDVVGTKLTTENKDYCYIEVYDE